MIELSNVSVQVSGPDADGLRVVLVVARALATADARVELRLDVELIGDADQLVAVLSLEAQPVAARPVLVEWSRQVHLPAPVRHARWSAEAAAVTSSEIMSQRLAASPIRAASAPAYGPSTSPAVATTPSSTPPVLVARVPRPASLPAAPAAPPPPPPDRFAQAVVEPWDDVAVLFPHDGLGIDGRERVRAMLKSRDEAEIVAACRIATASGWRTTVQAMRRFIDHPAAPVRAAAAHGIGELAGPAMEHLLRRLVETDSDESVRQAAATGVAAIAGRSRR